jgi:hypothetical protein
MEYTLRYEVEHRDGSRTTLYPYTGYSIHRPDGPVGYINELSDFGAWGPHAWKTYAGAQQNLRKFQPHNNILSATVIGWLNGRIEEVDDLEASRAEYGKRMESVIKERERYRAEEAALRSRVIERLAGHGIKPNRTSSYTKEVTLTFEQVHALLDKLDQPH